MSSGASQKPRGRFRDSLKAPLQALSRSRSRPAPDVKPNTQDDAAAIHVEDTRGKTLSPQVSQLLETVSTTDAAVSDRERLSDGAGQPDTESQQTPPTKPDQSASPDADATPYTLGNLWQEAFQKAEGKTKKWIEKNGANKPDSRPVKQQIDELVRLAKAKEKDCDDNSRHITVGSHRIILRDYAASAVDCLQTIGDIAIQFAPPQASIPWSVVKAVLQIPVNLSKEVAAVLGSAEHVLRIVRRGRVYELVFDKPDVPPDAAANLRSALLDLYTASLDILAESETLCRAGTLEQIGRTILQPGKAEGLAFDLSDLERTLTQEAQMCETGRRAAIDSRLEEQLRRLDAPLARVDERVEELLKVVDKKEREGILDWISSVQFGLHHDDVKEKRTEGTCEWLLHKERFREWEETRSSAVLWLQGSAGTGKTFLTSKVIDHVREILKGPKNHEGLAFFYCKQTEPSRREHLSIMQSYVRQLSTVAWNKRDTWMRTKLTELCDGAKRDGTNLRPRACKEQLLASVNLYPKTTLILDALDECDEDSRGDLINTLDYLLANSTRPLKVFVSSRPVSEITSRFFTRPSIEIDAKDNEEDIKKFIDEKLTKHQSWARVSPSLQMEIIETLNRRKDSMFQWVNLQIEELIRCKTGGARRDRLATLPGDLKAAYDKIYDRIENLKDRAVLERCVKWVMCACRPLSSEELLAAAQLDQNGESLIVDSPVSEETLLSLCNNLLVIDSQREVWQFSHFSVAEYFIDKHWTLQQAHSHVARMSLLLLMRQNPEAKEADPSESSPRGSELTSLPPGILKERHPLSEYVLLNWFRHTRSLEMELQKSEQAKDDAVARLLKSFLGSPRESSPQYRAWVFRAHRWGFWVDKEHDYQIKSSKLEPKNTPLFAMCIFSFYALLSDWWSGADIDTSMINAEGENLLALAAGSGCVSICKSLIGRGMDPNALLKGPEYGNSLGAAIQLNEMETVRFLLEKAGADPHMSLPGIYGSCLAIAAVCGLVNLARILIHEAHVDVNLQLQGGSYGSALAAAAAYGRIEIVKLLIKAGADVNALLPSGQFGSALSAAAHWGRTKIVKFLIQEAGARVEVFNKSRYPMEFIENFGYLPHWWRRIESVKFLVEEVGVDLSVLRQLGLTEGGETVFG